MQILTGVFKRMLDTFKSSFVSYDKITYEINGEPMTEEQRKHFDAAFAKMDEAFVEMKKAFDATSRRTDKGA